MLARMGLILMPPCGVYSMSREIAWFFPCIPHSGTYEWDVDRSSLTFFGDVDQPMLWSDVVSKNPLMSPSTEAAAADRSGFEPVGAQKHSGSCLVWTHWDSSKKLASWVLSSGICAIFCSRFYTCCILRYTWSCWWLSYFAVFRGFSFFQRRD